MRNESMKLELREAIEQGASNVFCALQDVSLSRPQAEVPRAGGDWLTSRLVVSGDYSGSVCFAATDSLCRILIATLFEGVEADRELEADALSECLNMITESARTLITQEGSELRVGAPVFSGRAAHPPQLATGAIELNALGEPVLLWFEVKPEDGRNG
jgi:CheY-specific phosphatase CheX